MMSTKPEELVDLLQKRAPKVEVTATKNTEAILSAIAFAKEQGYKVLSTPISDASDPGGGMSLLATYQFILITK